VPPDRITSCLLCFVFLVIACTSRLSGQVLGQSSSVASSSNPILVFGQVVNAVFGTPIPRALVRLNDRAVLTDHEGKFQFDQFAGPGNSIQATKPGFYLSTDPSEAPILFLQPDQLSKPIQIRLYPEALLTGTITAPDGEPLPRVFVVARRSTYDEMGRRSIPAGQGQTDSHGNFRITIPSGDYKLETRYSTRAGNGSEAILPISLPGQTQSNTSNTIHINSGEEQHFDLHPTISRAYTVAAKLEASSERGFPGITARSATGATIPVNFQRTAGSFNEGKMQLPSGTYTLTATMSTPEGAEQAETTVTVPDHDISGVVLRLAPNPSIPVELLVDSSATSDKSLSNIQQLGLTLQATQFDPDRGMSMVGLTTGRNQAPSFNPVPGSYRLQAQNNGEWYVKSANYGASDLLQQDLVVASGAGGSSIRVTVSNQTGALQGTVKLKGNPALCWIYLIPAYPSATPFMMFRSNTSGVYTIPYLPPGSYQVIAFEHRHSADYRAPDTLAAFTTYLHSVSINPGNKSTLDLDAVSAAETSQ
jgi:hypothetical protein